MKVAGSAKAPLGASTVRGVRPPAETTATARTGTVDVGALVSFRAAKP